MPLCNECNREFESKDNICPHCKNLYSPQKDYNKIFCDSNCQTTDSDSNGEFFEVYIARHSSSKKKKTVIAVILVIILAIITVIFNFGNILKNSKISNSNNSHKNINTESSTNSYVLSSSELKTSEKTQDNPDHEFSLGKINNLTYTNEYFGFGCTLTEEWDFTEQNKLLENYINIEDLSVKSDSAPESIINEVKKNGLYADMHAEGNGISSLNVVVEYNGESAGYLSEKSVLKQINTGIKSHYESMDANVSMCEVESVPFGNQKKYALHTSLTFNGTDFEAYQFVFIKDHYSAILTVSSDSIESLNSIVKQFYYLQN